MNKKILSLVLSCILLGGCGSNNTSKTDSSSLEENLSSSVDVSSPKEELSSEVISVSSPSIEEKAEYTVTFKADGQVVETITFTEGDVSINEPSVPLKEGYVGKWEEYTLGESNIEVEAIYTIDINIKNGGFKYEDNKYIASQDAALAINPKLTMENGTLSTTMHKSRGDEDSGIIFNVTYSSDELTNYWEAEGVSYYYFFVNVGNCAYLAKSENGVWHQLGRVENIANYNEEDDYPLSVSVNNGYITCFVGNDCLIKYQDANPLKGTGVGYRAHYANTSFTKLLVDNEVVKDSKDVIENYTVAHGGVVATDNGMKTTIDNTIAIENNIKMEEGKVYTTNYKANVKQDAGIIVALDDKGYRTFWEEANTTMEYYFFFINADGILILSKVGSNNADNVWTTKTDNNNIKDFNPTKTYKLGVEIVGSTIKCYVDGMLVLTHNTEKELVGRMVGVRAAKANAEFTPLAINNTKDDSKFEWYQRSGSFVEEENGTLTSYCDGSLAWANNKSLVKGSFSVDITASVASDTGIVFGCSDVVGARWEEKPYYFFFVNFNNDAILAGPVNGWTTFAVGGNVTDKLNAYGTANNLKVEIKDNYNIVCYVNGHEVINTTITDTSLQLSGTAFGVRCVGQGLRKFENFVLENK